MKHILITLAILLSATLQAQSIRKDYREFTPQELADYTNIMNDWVQNQVLTGLYTFNYDQVACSNIHTTSGSYCLPDQFGELYLPWHRLLLADVEDAIKNWDPLNPTNSTLYMTIPYWDWTTDYNTNAPAFWDNGFLSLNNFPNSGINRCIGTGACAAGSLPTTSDINALLALGTFYNPGVGPPSLTAPDFTHRAEAWKNQVNAWVGTTMGTLSTATDDPAFFISQATLDKIWQDWEDAALGQQTAIAHPNSILPFTGNYWQNTQAWTAFDSRSVPYLNQTSTRKADVWYASQGKLLLDGADGNPFTAYDQNTPYLYRYTTVNGSPLGGSIYVGDIQRDANNNVIADNKGGFVINANVKCDFRAGKSIEFLPGFEINAGATMEAKIITTYNGLAPSDPGTEDRSVEVKAVQALSSYPNPTADGAFTLYFDMPTAAETRIEVFDAMGSLLQNVILPAGETQIELSLESLPAGVYVVRAQEPGKPLRICKVIRS